MKEINNLRKLIRINKLRVYDELKKGKVKSIHSLSMKLGIDYKNMYRYIEEFKEKGIVIVKKVGDKKTYRHTIKLK